MHIYWQQIIATVLATVGGGSVALAAAAWLTKTLVSNRLALDAEKFKIEIKANADAEIERLKNSLQMAALEHQVRFSKLHEKRADVIREVYERLVEVYEQSRIFVTTAAYSAKPSE